MTRTLADQYVGLEEIDDGVWEAYFGPMKLRRMNERKLRIEDLEGHWVRETASPMSLN